MYELQTATIMKQVLTSLCLLFHCGTFAQEPRPLSLNDAIAITLHENPAIKAANQQIEAANDKRKAAIGLRAPQIELTSSFIHTATDLAIDANNLKAPFNKTANQIITQGVKDGIISQSTASLLQQIAGSATSFGWSYTLQNRNFGFINGQITMPLYLGGKINIASRVARIEQESSQEQAKQTTNALISTLVERYYGLSLTTEVTRVRELAMKGIEKHLSDAKAMESQGLIARSEVLFIEYKAAEARRQLYDAQLQEQTTHSALKTTLATDNNIMPTTSMFYIDSLENVEHYQTLAAERNPLLNQVGLQQSLAKENVALQRADFMPQVAAMMSGNLYEYQLSNILPRWAIGVGMKIKIFDGLNREYKYSAAKHTLQEVTHLVTQAQDNILLLVESIYNQLQNSLHTIASTQVAIRFATEYLRDKDIAFRDGWATATELIDAELNLAKARTELIEATYTFDVTLAKLLEAAGISNEYEKYLSSQNSKAITFNYQSYE